MPADVKHPVPPAVTSAAPIDLSNTIEVPPPDSAPAGRSTAEPPTVERPTAEPLTAERPTVEWRPAEPSGRLRPAAPRADRLTPAAMAPTGGSRRASQPEPVAPARRGGAVLRRSATQFPGPPSGRMLALCAWATAIGILGLAVAAWALAAVATGATPSWYEPALAVVGTTAVVLTAGAFATVRWVRLPWLMLGLATVPALVNIGLTLVGTL
jgi:hypothetical protein